MYWVLSGRGVCFVLILSEIFVWSSLRVLGFFCLLIAVFFVKHHSGVSCGRALACDSPEKLCFHADA